MRTSILILLLVVAAILESPAQESPKGEKPAPSEAAPADPFVKEKGKEADAGKPAEGPATVTNVGVVVQYIDVKRERWQEWLAANDVLVDATPLRKEVETWIAAGDAMLSESSLIMGRSGQRAKVESVRNLIYPGEFSEGGNGPAFPTKLETRNVGTTTEVDPVIDADGSVGINFAPERVIYAGENSPREDIGVLEGDFRFPAFEVQAVARSSKLDPETWALVGSERPFENAGTHLTLIFTRPLLHHFEVAEGNLENEPQGMLTLSWLEVSHAFLNDSLMKVTDPALWIGGGLHKEVRASELRVLEERSILLKSGQRSKNESFREVIFPTEWIPPSEGVFAVPTAFETRNAGITIEVDPVIGAGGHILDLNMAPDTTAFAGWDTLHRVLIGEEWKSSVTIPAFYRMQATTQLSLPLNTPVLAAVMSPANEKGWTEPSRKVLLFVKFSR